MDDIAILLYGQRYGQRSPIMPALAGSPLPHVWLFAPWWTLLGAAALATLVSANLWLSTRLVRAGRISCRQRRVGLLALLPASLAGPVCCKAPLVASLGVPTVLSLALAPYAASLSLALLSAHLLVSPLAMEGEAGAAALLIPMAFVDAWNVSGSGAASWVIRHARRSARGEGHDHDRYG